jgi:hypothetical protein
MSIYHFRKALPSEKAKIWEILQFAIQRRKEEGSILGGLGNLLDGDGR